MNIVILQAAEPPHPAATPSVLRLQPLCLFPMAKQHKEGNCQLMFYTLELQEAIALGGRDCVMRLTGVVESA